jgi:LVIVD repeat
MKRFARMTACCIAVVALQSAAVAATIPDRMNLELVGHSTLNGAGKGGEGLALKQYGSRKILFLAHESGPLCFSIIDVTSSADPVVLKQLPVEAEFVRCNSLGLSGNILVVARQSEKVGQPYGGIKIYDVTEANNPQLLSYLDLTGPNSRGTHYLTFTDGKFAYLSTGAKDFVPKNPLDDQMLMIVDLQNPKSPKELGRWWLPGTKVGDDAPAPVRVKPFDSGFRLHTPLVPPERPDRAYLGWIDGGIIVLDIADKTKPKEVSRISWQSLNEGFMHTVVPILDRGLSARFSRVDQRRLHGLANAGYHCRYPKGDAAIPPCGSATTGQFLRLMPGRRSIWRPQYQLKSHARDVARVEEHGRHRTVCRWIANLFHPRSSRA